MNDRTSSMAQLSRWTESMQQPAAEKKGAAPVAQAKVVQPQAAKALGNVEEEYDEEFEDYDEEFEEESPVKAPAPKSAPRSIPAPMQPLPTTISGVISPISRGDFKNQAQDKPSSTPSATAPPASEAKRVTKEEPAPAKRSKNLESLTSSLARSITDPRLVRIQRILQAGVLEMNSEKFTLLTLVPSSPYDFYMSALRKPDSMVKQAGVPVDQETREVEVNTDEVNTANVGIQACYGDDTAFFGLLDAARNKRNREAKQIPGEGDGTLAAPTSTVTRDDDGTGRGSSTLSSFLQRATNICEGLLLDEAADSKAESKPNRVDQQLLDASSPWSSLATDKLRGENELIRTRSSSVARFSALQTHMVLAIHPFPLGEEAELDLKTNKGLLSLWDTVSNPGYPSLLLECAGQPSSCCFSSTQAHIVLAGTFDGSLHLWDLREQTSLHVDKDAQDLKIAKGVRKPSFSTHLSLSLGAADEAEEAQHSAGIVQIESMGDQDLSMMVSQFVSLDERGAIVFWVASEAAQRASDVENLKRSPWGRVVLMATKQILTQALVKTLDVRSASSGSGKSLQWLQTDYSASSLLLPEVLCGIIPDDSSTVLVGAWKGELVKAARVGDATNPRILQRPASGSFAHVTSISVRERASTSEPSLILVGREDGTVDLFQSDTLFPLVTWQCGGLVVGQASVRDSRESKVVLVRWMQAGSATSASFLVVTDRGAVCHFNLLEDLYHPAQVDSLGLKGRLRPFEVDVSRMKTKTDACRIVACNRREPTISVKMRRLNSQLFAFTDQRDAEKVLSERLTHLIAPAVAKPFADRQGQDKT